MDKKTKKKKLHHSYNIMSYNDFFLFYYNLSNWCFVKVK